MAFFVEKIKEKISKAKKLESGHKRNASPDKI
jgi:hypothetical protein